MMRRYRVLTVSLFMVTCLVASGTAVAAQTVDDDAAGDEDAIEDVHVDEEVETQEVNWQFGARIRPRLEARFNHHFGLDEAELNYPFQPDQADQFTQQSRLNAQAQRQGLTAFLTLQHAAVWGDFGGDQLTAPPLTLYEARIRYDEPEHFFVDVGRFELAYGDQRVLGSVGWSQVGRAWDGLRLGFRPGEEVKFDTFVARYTDGSVDFLGGDSILAGLYATWQQPVDEVMDSADLYILYDASQLRLDPMIERATIGSRFVFGPGDFDLSAEGAFQFGTDCRLLEEDICEEASVAAYFADIEAGYSIAELRPFLGGSIASGDDPDTERIEAYDQLYPTGHAFLGYMDLIGPRTNLIEVRAGVQGTYEWLNYEVVAHHFRRLQPQAESVGIELNTKIFATLTQGLNLGVGHGLFIPDDGISATEASAQGVANWSFAQLVGAF